MTLTHTHINTHTQASYSGSNVVAELSQGFEDLGFTVSANPGFSTFYLNATTEQGEDMEIEVDATAVPVGECCPRPPSRLCNPRLTAQHLVGMIPTHCS